MRHKRIFRVTLRGLVLFVIGGAVLLIVDGKRASGQVVGASTRSLQGVVRDGSGAPLKGAWVQARDLQTKILTSVLSDRQGQYWFDNLPPGEYEVTARGSGFTTDRRGSVKLEAGQSPRPDFTIKSRPVEWRELSEFELFPLLPDRKGKEESLVCFGCHGVMHTLEWVRSKDVAGWRQAITFMRAAIPYYFAPKIREGVVEHYGRATTDEKLEVMASYLASVFGPEGDLPQYPNIKPREYSDQAMNIVYVEYDLPSRNGWPLSATPDNQTGYVWIPEWGLTNQIARLKPKTGEIKEYKVPYQGHAAIHSAVPAPDGTVWLTESSEALRIAKFDPQTEKFTEYPDPRDKGTRSKHTNVVDRNGHVWSSGGDVITRFDPKSEKYSYYGDKPLNWGSYGIATDRQGNVWFARLEQHRFGKIDGKTGKVKEWERPNAGPRRVHVDSKGYVWFGEYHAGKAVRFDPTTETFQEYPLRGPQATPYAVGIDASDNFWYWSNDRKESGKVDNQTGRVTVYPVPPDDMSSRPRDLFRDSEGQMWFGVGAANRVGYFHLRK